MRNDWQVRLVFYSICAVVPFFITGIRIKEMSSIFSISTSTFPAEKKEHFIVLLSTVSNSK